MFTTGCFAQLPETDLWLFSLKNEKGNLSIRKGENITQRKGYDNQPSFSSNETVIYYSSVREDNQSDVFEYAIASKKTRQLTYTKESEYSPTPLARTNEMACVTVQQDSAQIISVYEKNKADKTDALKVREWKNISSFDSVGYFVFLNQDSLLYYKLTKPHSLRLRSLSSDKDIFIAANPARGFKAISRSRFIFGIKDSSSVYYYLYDCVLKKGIFLSNYPSVNEDIFFHPVLGIMKSEGAQILVFNEPEKQWKKLFDFSTYGIKKITRFAIDSKLKKIVIVNNE